MNNFWTTFTPAQREEFRREQILAAEEEQIRRSQLIHHKGKLIAPEDFPCTCELQDPWQCYASTHRTKESDRHCRCKCHSKYEPW